MKIKCAKCKQQIPADQINMSTDLAFCTFCNEAFKISEAVDLDIVNVNFLQNPPKGAWFRNEPDNIVVGATTRSPIAFLLVPFMIIWSGGSVGGIYGSQIIEGQFDPIRSLFGIPFLLGSVLFWSIALMAIWGKVEVTIGEKSYVFVGLGKLGWKRHFDWHSVTSVSEGFSKINYPGSHNATIVLDGQSPLKFGTGLNEKRKHFVLNVLKYLHSKSR